LQSFKNTFLSRNLDQNMLKMLQFLKKAGKIASAPNPPLAFGGWGLQTAKLAPSGSNL